MAGLGIGDGLGEETGRGPAFWRARALVLVALALVTLALGETSLGPVCGVVPR